MKAERLFIYAILYIYSACYAALLIFIFPFRHLHKKLAQQMDNRTLSAKALSSINQERRKFKHCVIFYCSSAGEYEQAKPLIERHHENGDTYVFILFFSKSGLEFAEARSEKTPHALCPFDTVWHWQSLMNALNPNVAIVVRHEIWPAFILMTLLRAKLLMINLSHTRHSYLSRLSRQLLLAPFDQLYLVSPADQASFSSHFTAKRITVCGDTKYDRVIERASQNVSKIAALKTQLGALANRKILIGGSVWQPDVDFIQKAFTNLTKQEQEQITIILAPHDISAKMILEIETQLAGNQLVSKLLSDTETEFDPTKHQILIVDQMGQLAEFYGLAQLCFLGGAIHSKIHNVLEPAVYGLPIACGTNYQNQKEAVMLADAGLMTPVISADELSQWWSKNLSEQPQLSATIRNKILSLAGASDKIHHDIRELFET